MKPKKILIYLSILLLSAAFELFPGSRAAFAQSDAVSREEFLKVINELKKQNQELAKELKELKKEKPGSTAELTNRVQQLEQKQVSGGDIAEVKKEVNEIASIVETVERKALLDRVQFTPELRTRLDWFDYRDSNSHTGENVDALGTTRFRLNLKSDLTDNLKLTGRLTMYKRWQNNNDFAYSTSPTYNRSRVPGDSDLRVERIYADYNFKLSEKLPMTLTFGRLPDTDGMPTNLREDTPRKSTFPGLAFDAEADGISLALSLAETTGLPDSALRFSYVRLVDDSDTSMYQKSPYKLDSNDIFMAQFETGLPDFMRNGLFILNFIYLSDFPTYISTNSALRPVDIPGNSGDVMKITPFIMCERFLDSSFDWFAGYSWEHSSGGRPAQYRYGFFNKASVGLLSDKKRDTNSQAFYVGMRYALPWKALNGAKLGIEYNYGSKNWIGLNLGSEDPLHKLDVNGHAWDFYYLQPIMKYFNIRAGYTMLKRSYYNTMLGKTNRADEDIRDAYLLLDVRFY